MPSDNYDIRLEDQNGYDLLEGVGANRDITKTEHAPIIYASTSLNPTVRPDDTLFLVIDNQFTPSAQILVEVWFAMGY